MDSLWAKQQVKMHVNSHCCYWRNEKYAQTYAYIDTSKAESKSGSQTDLKKKKTLHIFSLLQSKEQ